MSSTGVVYKKSRWHEFRRKLKKQKVLLLFLLPVVVLYILFSYMPMYGIIAAFQDFSIFKGYGGSPFVGLKNFRDLTHNPDFIAALLYTLRIAVLRLIITQPIPILFALMLHEISCNPFKRTVQTITYLPHFISWVIIGGIIYNLLGSRGPVNALLGLFNVPRIGFLENPRYFPGLIITSGVWKETGYSSILYLAAMSAVDPALKEAARIDGAGRFRLIWNITLPCILPTIVIQFIWATGSLASVSFDQVFNLQNSLIRNQTQVLDTLIYYEGLKKSNYSFGVAAGLLTGLMSFCFIMLSNWVAKKVTNIGIV